MFKTKKVEFNVKIEMAEFIASYMCKTNQKEVTIEELKAAYEYVSGYLKDVNANIEIDFSRETKIDKVPCFADFFVVTNNTIKLKDSMDLETAYIIFIKGMWPSSKERLTEAMEDYVTLQYLGMVDNQ